jgi:hypothetical protein
VSLRLGIKLPFFILLSRSLALGLQSRSEPLLRKMIGSQARVSEERDQEIVLNNKNRFGRELVLAGW